MKEASWRVKSRCRDCPFNETGPGRTLRDSLTKERWRGILRDLASDKHFICHKTGDETGNGSNLVCAGSLDYSEKHGLSQNYVRIMERLDAMNATKAPTDAKRDSRPTSRVQVSVRSSPAIINSVDQVVAIGGGPIIHRRNSGMRAISYSGWRVSAWDEWRKKVNLDPGGPWYNEGEKAFPRRDEPPRSRDPNALADAKAWCAERFGVTKWKRNELGDYVPAGCPPIKRRCGKARQERT